MSDVPLPIAALVLVAGSVAIAVGGLLVVRRSAGARAPAQRLFRWLLVGGGAVTLAMSYLSSSNGGRPRPPGRAPERVRRGRALPHPGPELPFPGDVHVSRGPFEHALLNFDALDLQAEAAAAPVPTRTDTVVVDARRAFTDTGLEVPWATGWP